MPALQVNAVAIAPEAVADFGPDGLFTLLDRNGLVLTEIH
jgi:hypothetical protein